MPMKKGEWRKNRLGRMVRVKQQPSGGQLVEHLTKRSPGRPPKASLSNGAIPPAEDALQAILDRSFQKLSVVEKIAALDPRKKS